MNGKSTGVLSFSILQLTQCSIHIYHIRMTQLTFVAIPPVLVYIGKVVAQCAVDVLPAYRVPSVPSAQGTGCPAAECPAAKITRLAFIVQRL
jgi:hypothetical protein